MLSRTIDSAAAWRNKSSDSAPGTLRSCAGSGTSSTPIRSRAERSRNTAASTSASATSPPRTAATTLGPRARPGPGISRSSPAPSDVAVSATANQSVMTSPSKPHSSRRMSSRNCGCWVSQRPLSRLYAVMMARAPPSRMAISNGRRYSSRSARSSMTELMVPRSNSASLPTKCLTVAKTPFDWTPRT